MPAKTSRKQKHPYRSASAIDLSHNNGHDNVDDNGDIRRLRQPALQFIMIGIMIHRPPGGWRN